MYVHTRMHGIFFFFLQKVKTGMVLTTCNPCTQGSEDRNIMKALKVVLSYMEKLEANLGSM